MVVPGTICPEGELFYLGVGNGGDDEATVVTKSVQID